MKVLIYQYLQKEKNTILSKYILKESEYFYRIYIYSGVKWLKVD